MSLRLSSMVCRVLCSLRYRDMIKTRSELLLFIGIDDDGPMHPKSPHISAPDGVVTLLYKMGREDWMRRFLDVEGTHKFELVLRYDGPYEDFYVDRKGRDVEVCVNLLKTHRVLTLGHGV